MVNQKPENKRKLASQWDAADFKLLLITAAGTLIANLATVIIIALGFIIAKTFAGNGATKTFAIVNAVGYAVLVPLIARDYIRAKRKGKGIKRALMVLILYTFGLTILLLTIIGIAVGVK